MHEKNSPYQKKMGKSMKRLSICTKALCKPLLTTAIMTVSTLCVDIDRTSGVGSLLSRFGLASVAQASGYTINTIAGTGTYDSTTYLTTTGTFSDSGTPSAFGVNLAAPCAVVKDSTDSSIVFIDHDHSAIRRISNAGVVSTILSGFNVNTFYPQFLTIDGATGSLYATDGQNVFTIPKSAGTYGTPVIFATTNTNSSSGTNSGALGWSATPTYDSHCWYSCMDNPQGIAYAPLSGGVGPYLYVGGASNVYQIDLNVSDVTGGHYAYTQIVSGLNYPTGLALNAAANALYVVDNPSGASTGCCVRHYTVPAAGTTAASTGDIIAGSAASVGSSGDSGDAPSALLQNSTNIAIDSDGDLYIADTVNNRIRYVPAATSGSYTAGNIYTIAGGGSSAVNEISAASAQLYAPTGLFVDANKTIFMTEGSSSSSRNFIRTVALPASAITVGAGITNGTNILIPYYSALNINGGGTLKVGSDNSTQTYGGISLAGAGSTFEVNDVLALGAGAFSTNILTLRDGTGIQAGSSLAASTSGTPSALPVPINYSGTVTINTADDAGATHSIATLGAITCTALSGTTNTITVKGGGYYTPGAEYTAGQGSDAVSLVGSGTTLNLINSRNIPSTVKIGNGAILNAAAGLTLPTINIG